ncbi:MAG: hypothetical protein RJA37_1072 [Verrucomicrobiota bacterium]
MSEIPPRPRSLIPGQVASWLAVVALVGAVTAASVAAFLHFRTGVSPEAATSIGPRGSANAASPRRSASTVASTSGIARPNLAFSPTELPQRPVLRLESLARMPMNGAAPSSRLAWMIRSTSSACSITTTGWRPRRRARIAVSM